eukprot:TRINITY_DN17303_c0_g1_i1.p1 TRINITY_DN17303_c0_g1~~TRINITY_DN17303_c0_g1_i1.p1  ORF type:complete len:389 (+),score=52.36 TRINITY_DN17303_c0_g1_i1:22-1188(+)
MNKQHLWRGWISSLRSNLSTRGVRGFALGVSTAVAIGRYNPKASDMHVIPQTDQNHLDERYPQDLKLLQVNMVFRHGDRSPIRQWNPMDPIHSQGSEKETQFNAEDEELRKTLTWICDDDYGEEQDHLSSDVHDPTVKHKECHAGQLTRKGKYTQQRIGAALRRIYVDHCQLLPEELDGSQMILRSTNIPRTKKSLQAIMTLLYPREARPKRSQLDSEYNGVPFEIRSFEKGEETLFCDDHCPAVKKLFEEYYASPEYKRYQERVDHLKEHLHFFTSQKHTNGKAISLTDVYDHTNCRQAHGKALTHGLDEGYLQELETISSVHWWGIFSHPTLGRAVSRLGMGRLLSEISSNMNTSSLKFRAGTVVCSTQSSRTKVKNFTSFLFFSK